MTIRVMLADDQRMLRDLLRASLEREPDIEVVGEAADGRTLLELVRECTPQVVVLDIAMPELGGIEATARLLARHPELKVVVLSVHDDRRYVLEMLKRGASGYVVKSSAGTELLRAIRAVVRGQKYLCPEVAATVIDGVKGNGNPTEPAGKLARLGTREREVLKLLAEGRRSAEVAMRLHISVATVDTHRRNIMRKLDLHNIVALTKFAMREGLVAS